MRTGTLDERYLVWLYGQVAEIKVRSRARRHWNLVRRLHETIFVAIVPHDENRVADAKDLRRAYLDEHEEERWDRAWMRSPATMMEVLLVLAKALAFETDEPTRVWFWHLIDTLELRYANDSVWDAYVEDNVDSVLERVIWRQYSSDGRGGLFPLDKPVRDQRDVELWYQLNAYLLEHF